MTAIVLLKTHIGVFIECDATGQITAFRSVNEGVQFETATDDYLSSMAACIVRSVVQKSIIEVNSFDDILKFIGASENTSFVAITMIRSDVVKCYGVEVIEQFHHLFEMGVKLK